MKTMRTPTPPAAEERAGSPLAPSPSTRTSSMPARLGPRPRDGLFLLGMLAVIAATVAVLAAGGSALTSRRAATSPTAAPASLGAQVVAGQVQQYMFPAPSPGLMEPSVDAAGNVWVGEMSTNKLARLNPHTGAVSTWTPPGGKFNIMETAVDRAGDVWFTEQAANYIGRFHPATQRFTTYPLEQVNGHSSAPQALAFDSAGKLWFTELTSSKIGRLDPATGAITTWRVPSITNNPSSYPYALAPHGGQVWFGYLSGGAVGRLDPATGKTQVIKLANTQAQIFSMTSDAQGRVWFTELEQGKIGMIDTATGRATEIAVPAAVGGSPAAGLYGIVAAKDGSVWFACSSANALVQYDPDTQFFIFHTLTVPGSVPYGVALDGEGRVWFSADASPRNYVGRMLS